MKGLQDVVNQAKSLVQRLRDKESAVDATLKDVNTLNEQLNAMRQFREEAVVQAALGKDHANDSKWKESEEKPPENNSDGENQNKMEKVHSNAPKAKPTKADSFILSHQPIVLALLSENRRLSALEAENAELVKCLEEYQAALDMIMHKYRTHVTKFASVNQKLSATVVEMSRKSEAERKEAEVDLLNKINDMAAIMRHACELDDNYYVNVVSLVTRLHNENKCLRELLDSRVTGSKSAPQSSNGRFKPHYASTQPPQMSHMLLNGGNPTTNYQESVIIHNSRINQAANNSNYPSSTSGVNLATSGFHESQDAPSGLNAGRVVLQTAVNGLPYHVTAGASSSAPSRFSLPSSSTSSYLTSAQGQGFVSPPQDSFKLPRRPVTTGISVTALHSKREETGNNEKAAPAASPSGLTFEQILAMNENADDEEEEGEMGSSSPNGCDDDDSASMSSLASSVATLCPAGESSSDNVADPSMVDDDQQEIEDLVNEMMNLDDTATGGQVETTIVEAS